MLTVLDHLNGEADFVHFGLWVTTVVCVCGAIVFALIGALMAIVNTTLTPVEMLAGRAGLFVWNSMSSKYLKIRNRLHILFPKLID